MSSYQNKNDNPWVVTFSPQDTLENKLRKAAHVKPSKAQLAWMEKEYIAFIHFGPNTFSGRQWGTGQEDPTAYAPTALDPSQWARVCSQAGMKMAIFTMKHHDGCIFKCPLTALIHLGWKVPTAVCYLSEKNYGSIMTNRMK